MPHVSASSPNLSENEGSIVIPANTFIVQRTDTVSQGAVAELGGVRPVKSWGLPDLIS